MKREPFQQQCSNAPGVTYWTCPGCFTDINRDEVPDHNVAGDSAFTCPSCGHGLRLTIEMEPVYRARIDDDQEEADE